MTQPRNASDQPLSSTASSAPRPTTHEVEERVRTHLPLVGHLVRETLARVPAHVCRDALTSAGMYGLTVSAQTFDRSQGVPFARFATIRIRGALTDELRSMDWASRSVRSRARDLDTARSDLTQALGRPPSRTELCQALAMSAKELAAVESDVARASVVSLQALTPEAGSEVLPALGEGPEALLVRREQIGYLHDAIAELPERLRMVVSEYFFGQRKMTEIAADLGVTESRVSQLRSEALAFLRVAMGSHGGEAQPEPDAAPRGRELAARTYCATVATRSTLASRLSATTLLGERRAVAGAGPAGWSLPAAT